MTVTLQEQGRVALHSRPARAPSSLTHAEGSALLEIGQRMGVRLASWEDPNALRLHQFVGAVRAGELEVEILPKIEGAPDVGAVRRSLLHMLVVAEDLDLSDSEVVRYFRSDEPVLAAVARLYCAKLAEAVRRRLRQEYVTVEERVPRIRGKVNWAAQARLQTTLRLEFDCVFDERSEDTAFNRTLKAALGRAAAMLERAPDAALNRELRHAMADVSDEPPPADQLARLRTDRLNCHLEPLLSLAKLLLGNRNPDLGRCIEGDSRSHALVWDMNVLFERFIGRLLGKILDDCTVVLQEASTYLAHDPKARRAAFLLVPDVLVHRAGACVAVADTKWKVLDPSDATLGVGPADIYQLVTYARRFRAAQAALIYPHRPALGRPGLQREYVVAGPEETPLGLKVITVDLAALDGVAGDLVTALEIAPMRATRSLAGPALLSC